MMARVAFQRDLKSLEHAVLTVGSIAASAVESAMSSLSLRSATLAHGVIDGDNDLDERVHLVEEHGTLLIVTQQPMAGDLRTIMSAVTITAELERIGDYAEGIAKISLSNLAESPLPEAAPMADVYCMAERVTGMLRSSMEAFADRDLEAARQIWNDDDEIDEFQRAIYEKAQHYMRDDPSTIGRVIRLLWVVHNLERSADRVTNICERIAALVTGERLDLKAR